MLLRVGERDVYSRKMHTNRRTIVHQSCSSYNNNQILQDILEVTNITSNLGKIKKNKKKKKEEKLVPIRNLHHRKFTMRLLPHKRSLTMMITTENMQINGTKFAGKNVEFCVKVIGAYLQVCRYYLLLTSHKAGLSVGLTRIAQFCDYGTSAQPERIRVLRRNHSFSRHITFARVRSQAYVTVDSVI